MIGLEFVRKLRKVTLKDIGDLIGISKQGVSKWEHGEKPIPEKYKEALSKYLSVPEEYLDKELDEVDQRVLKKLYDEEVTEAITNEYYAMRTEIVNLTNQLEDVFVEKYCAPDQAPNLEEMRRCLSSIERMIAMIKKGEFDD